ncbi:MAG: HAMP domain-containing histidine kinase, partial [Arenicella sp.]|nr:HAMP domain-containing histidine kinase [Arenicella sp.]
RLSGTSYRLFKQLSDEVILGQSASQAFVRDKRALISKSLNTIKQLELEQRDALGIKFTKGSFEDTDDLEVLIDEIIQEFQIVVMTFNDTPLNQQERLRSLLEVTIDGKFRQLINSAINRQSSVVASINSRINTLNSTVIWFTVGLGVLSLLTIDYVCYWWFNQLYQPIILIRSATNAIASGEYEKPIPETLDGEFEELSSSINQLAERLKEHESKENKSRKQLELAVDQRTAELTRANLELTKIDARRRQFISDISHELRTPLTIIRGEAQITLRMQEASQEDYIETLSSILEQSINLSNLVDDLLFLTRAEMHQLDLDVAPVNLFELIETEVSRWQRHCPDRVFSFNSCEQAENIEVLIDKPRIQQVLSILIDNSSKYSKISGPINIGLTNQTEHIDITVNDCGDGISAAEVENIFERFVRFSRNDEGLGLGLPIAKAIIEAHGGKITVESVQGDGSTFSIKLPTSSDL